MKNKIIPYNPRLKYLARKLRKQGILSEILIWKEIKNKSLSVEFHRQVPIGNYIVDFYCHELMLAIEIDGGSHDIDVIAEKDIIRQQKLESVGVNFIRFMDKDVRKDMNTVLDALQNRVEELRRIKNIPRPADTPFKGGENIPRPADTPFKGGENIPRPADTPFKGGENIPRPADTPFKGGIESAK